jgi:hypothetical protein
MSALDRRLQVRVTAGRRHETHTPGGCGADDESTRSDFTGDGQVHHVVAGTEEQIERAIGYFKAIENTTFYSLRILGSLVELYALIGRRDRYAEYLKRVANLKNKEASRFSQAQMHGLEESLSRAQGHIALQQIDRGLLQR